MTKLPGTILRVLLLTALAATHAHADQVTVDKSDPERTGKPPAIIVPYAFSTEALETGIGAVYFKRGLIQPEDGFFLTGYGTSNSSFGLFGGMTNVKLSKRLFFNPTLGIMSNDQQRFYGDFGYELGGQPPSGSNDSTEDDFIFGGGIDSYMHLTFRYVMPIGAGKEDQPHRYTMDEGLLSEGSTNLGAWNPWKSGRTFIVLRPFYQRRTLDVDESNIDLFPPIFPVELGDEADYSTNGLMLGIEYDNTDFVTNPSKGSKTMLNVHRDFGAFDSLNSWTSLDFSFSKFFNLGKSKLFRQQVFAANVWAAYSPTWETELVGTDVVAIRNRPPGNRGATLGGVERQRGYPRGRFNDKAAINYTAELRLIPNWDPFKTWPVIRKWPWRWWQVVGFAEIGRVAPSWNFGDLHDDMKWTAGGGIRAMIGGGIIRLDFAASDEAAQFWVMAKQSF